MIADLTTVRAVFARMQADGVDTARPLRWGFFFMHFEREPLERVLAELADHGYVVEELGDREDGGWVLHVSKVEALTPDKLHRRNAAFNELAEYCGVELYDGWDVEVPDRAG